MKEIIVPLGKDKRLRYVIKDDGNSNLLSFDYYEEGWVNAGGGRVFLGGENWVNLDEFADAVQRLQKLLVLE